MRFLTDAERQIRPGRFRLEFRYWVEFTLPIKRDGRLKRWFATPDARDRYEADMIAEGAEILGKGDEDA